MTARKDTAAKPIYVVGFPKSGNTWLTRLLADVLLSPVESHPGIGLELATEINHCLSLPTDTGVTIVKAHFLPSLFLDQVDDAPAQIVYVYRDFRDVAISAFFYWNRCSEIDVQIASLLPSIFRGPRSLFRSYRCRRRLTRYLVDLCVGNIEWFRRVTGTWSEHVAQWRDLSAQRPGVRIAYVSYEELLSDTVFTVLRIIRTLRLREPVDTRVEDAVQRQSFAALKRHFRKLEVETKLPFGKDFNLRFLRKGVSGDWRNYLSPRMGEIIQKYHGTMLFELGYESDPYWYKKINRGGL